MSHDVIMPQLAMGMSEGTIVGWLVKPGQKIERDDPVAEVETEKVVVELPAPASGYFYPLVELGATVPVEQLVARIADTKDKGEATETVVEDAPSKVSVAEEPSQTPGVSRRGKRISVSGLARRIAEQNDIALAGLKGTGPKVRIVRRDVEAAILDARARARPSKTPEGQKPERARRPYRGMRSAIGQTMTRAYAEAAQTFVFFELDVTRLVASRARLNNKLTADHGRLTLTAYYLKALAKAVAQVPQGNATLEGDEIIFWENVDVALAVAIPGQTEFDSGIQTPVIMDVASKSVLSLSVEIAEKAARAREGRLARDETGGATVTLSPGGFYPEAGLVGLPLLNLPHSLSFSPGRPVQKPVVREGEITVADMLPCTMTFDHRIMDGEPAGRIARIIGEQLSDPELLMI